MVSVLPNRFQLNSEFVADLIAKDFGGSAADFCRAVGLDEKTARRWITDHDPTVNAASVRHAASALGYPVAMFASRYTRGSVQPGPWAKLTSAIGGAARYIHWGEVLPPDPARPHIASWSYHQPAEPCWALLRLEPAALPIDVVFTMQKFFGPLTGLVDYGYLKCAEGELSCFEVWSRRTMRKKTDAPRSFNVLTWCDDWASAFLVRSNVPLEVEKLSTLNELDAMTRLDDPQDATVGFLRMGWHRLPKDAVDREWE